MSAETIIFIFLTLLILGGAIMAVTSTKIFRAAVYLLFSMIGIAGLYFLLNYEFLGAVQIVVYVGGVIVLIIFSIFLTSDANLEMKKTPALRLISTALATLFGLAFTIFTILKFVSQPTSEPPIEASVRNLGLQMLDLKKYGFVLPFEAVSILLLAAMIGCIVIALKTRTREE